MAPSASSRRRSATFPVGEDRGAHGLPERFGSIRQPVGHALVGELGAPALADAGFPPPRETRTPLVCCQTKRLGPISSMRIRREQNTPAALPASTHPSPTMNLLHRRCSGPEYCDRS